MKDLLSGIILAAEASSSAQVVQEVSLKYRHQNRSRQRKRMAFLACELDARLPVKSYCSKLYQESRNRLHHRPVHLVALVVCLYLMRAPLVFGADQTVQSATFARLLWRAALRRIRLVGIHSAQALLEKVKVKQKYSAGDFKTNCASCERTDLLESFPFLLARMTLNYI